MNIWSDRSAGSSYRCVVFIQPPPQHQQHLYPAQSPPQELGHSQALCMFPLPPSNASISCYRHLSPEQWRRFLSEPLIPARCCRGNAQRSGSWAAAGVLGLKSSSSAKLSSRRTITVKDCVKRAEEELDKQQIKPNKYITLMSMMASGSCEQSWAGDGEMASVACSHSDVICSYKCFSSLICGIHPLLQPLLQTFPSPTWGWGEVSPSPWTPLTLTLFLITQSVLCCRCQRPQLLPLQSLCYFIRKIPSPGPILILFHPTIR